VFFSKCTELIPEAALWIPQEDGAALLLECFLYNTAQIAIITAMAMATISDC
jgi:hypothetical protein